MTRPVNLSTPVKAIALVVFLAAIAGATYGVQMYLGDSVGGSVVSAQPVRATQNVTAGHQATFAVALHNRGDAEAQLVAALTGPAGVQGVSPAQRVAAGQSATVFVTVDVPADVAPGDHPLLLTVRDASNATLRERPDAATLRVLAPAEGYKVGDTGRVMYVGRLSSNGQVFNTNDPALQDQRFPQTSTYRFSSGLLEVRSVPRPSVVEGFFEGLLGMQPGETRTVSFPAEKGYGNATVEETVPRERVIERRETLDLPEAPLSTASFAEYLESTGQGTPDDFEVGDLVRTERDGEVIHYRVVSKTDEGVTLRFHVEVGEKYTVYPFFPNGSVVETIGETTAVFYTTPPMAEGEPFTFFDYWPGLSRVSSLNETHVVIRHDPPVGNAYEQPGGQFQPARQYTVVDVREDGIVVSTPSQNQLAGQALTFDITLVEIVPPATQ